MSRLDRQGVLCGCSRPACRVTVCTKVRKRLRRCDVEHTGHAPHAPPSGNELLVPACAVAIDGARAGRYPWGAVRALSTSASCLLAKIRAAIALERRAARRGCPPACERRRVRAALLRDGASLRHRTATPPAWWSNPRSHGLRARHLSSHACSCLCCRPRRRRWRRRSCRCGALHRQRHPFWARARRCGSSSRSTALGVLWAARPSHGVHVVSHARRQNSFQGGMRPHLRVQGGSRRRRCRARQRHTRQRRARQ